MEKEDLRTAGRNMCVASVTTKFTSAWTGVTIRGAKYF